MSGGGFVDESVHNFKGINRWFNSYTFRGRLTWVLSTYGMVFATWGLLKMRKSRKAVAAAKAS